MDVLENRKELGKAIRQAREQQKLSQRKLALMAGTNQTHLWKIETGQTDLGIDLLCRISDALDVKVSDLISF